MLISCVIVSLAGISAAQRPPSAAGVISGRVVEQGVNAPVPDARVQLVVATRPVAGQPPQTREAYSGLDGTFRFEGLEPGAYRLIVNKPGFVNPGPRDILNPPPLIRIEAGKASTAAVLTLERGAVITGRVLSPNGQPVSDTRVGVFRRSQRAPDGQLIMAGPPATTNDLGEFRLHSLAAGEYFVQAGPRPASPMARTAPSATMIAPTFYPGTTDPATAQPLSVGRGVTLTGIEVVLLEAPAFSVRGVVVDDAGRPVENAAVMLLADSAAGMSTLASPGRTRTSADGQFRIDGVMAGTYVARASAPDVTKSSPSTGVLGGTIGGTVGPLTGGLAGAVGPAYMTETVGGVTTTYRFEQAQDVRIRVESGDVTDLQLVAKRP
jgi:protocatechuate 3,4-dioxygenase beta subunit